MRLTQSNLRSTRRPGRHGPTAAASVGGGAAPSPPPDPASLPATTRLRLSVPYHTAYGHHLAVVGDHPALGEWAPERAVPMAWGDGGERGDTWSVELATPAVASSPASAAAGGGPAPSPPAWSYKYIVREGDRALDWSQGDNFPLPLPPGGPAILSIDDAWDGARHEVVVEEFLEVAAVTGEEDAEGGEGVRAPPAHDPAAAAAAAAELSAALVASAEAVALFGPASRAALEADARVSAAEAAVKNVME